MPVPVDYELCVFLLVPSTPVDCLLNTCLFTTGRMLACGSVALLFAASSSVFIIPPALPSVLSWRQALVVERDADP